MDANPRPVRNFPLMEGSRTVSKLLAIALAVVAGVFAIGVSSARADGYYPYFNGISCCANRDAAAYNSFLATANAATSGSKTQVACVQEDVYPNYPSDSGNFFDDYKCGPGGAAHGLNGLNYDRPYCWINGAVRNFTCIVTAKNIT
jgi:hypothetical protein